jgi:hypothetical protein
VQFSNGVSANTHKEFARKFMTMAHILDEGVLSLSFHLEGVIRTRKHPQVEKKEDTVGRVTMINGAMSSTLMG